MNKAKYVCIYVFLKHVLGKTYDKLTTHEGRREKDRITIRHTQPLYLYYENNFSSAFIGTF